MINIKKFLGLEYYTSGLDTFLAAFRKEHPKPSASQQAEMKKYDKVFQMRDEAVQPTAPSEKLWDKF